MIVLEISQGRDTFNETSLQKDNLTQNDVWNEDVNSYIFARTLDHEAKVTICHMYHYPVPIPQRNKGKVSIRLIVFITLKNK